MKAFTLQSDAFRQYDASIFKNFALPGESVLSFRAEFFNLPNTTSFNAPSSTIDAIVLLHGDFNLDPISRYSICFEIQLLTTKALIMRKLVHYPDLCRSRCMRRHRFRNQIPYPFKSTSRSRRGRIRRSTVGLVMTSRTTRQ